MDFVIPLRREDLLNASAGQYRVEELLTVREITRKWDECQTSLDEQGATFIIEYFDVLYSCILHGNGLDQKYHQQMFNMLRKGLSLLINDLNVLLDDEEELDAEIKSQSLMTLKMLCYLLCQLMHKFESEAAKPVSQLVNANEKGKKKGKALQHHDDDHWAWDSKKYAVVQLLQQLFSLSLNRLWTPPIIEEEFLNLISNGCYKLLENTAINRTKEMRDAIFELLGRVLKLQKHVIGCAVKIVQMLQLFEHLAIPLAHGIILFAREYGMKNMLNEVIREIGSSEAEDLSADGVATRAFSTFLVEVAQHVPELILSNISILATHLNGESYSMRNCVLGIMGEIVTHTLGRTEMDAKSRKIRDQFLDHLEDHVHDVNAFVRSRVLQIWTKLSQEQVVPLGRQKNILKLVIGRLTDKACSVRKSAIQLLTAFLQGNPFAAKLSLDELKANLEKEKAKLAELTNGASENSRQANSDTAAADEWAGIEEQLEKLVNAAMDMETKDEDLIMLSRHELTGILVSSLSSRNLEKVASAAVLLHAKLASANDDENPIGNDQSCSKQSTLEQIMDALKTIYLENCTFQKSSAGQVNDSSDSDVSFPLPMNDLKTNTNAAQPTEVEKQMIVVQYFKDTTQFAELLSQALPLVSQLLGSSQNTDVLEAIQFFMTACHFGVVDAILGVRKMLPLIWSKEAGIKTAVMEAYKSLYLQGHPDKGAGEKQKCENVVRNLTMLTMNASIGDLESLEELICEFVNTGDVNDSVFAMLWERFANKNGNYAKEDSNAAVILLSMVGRSKREMIENNLHTLVNVGLGSRRASNNFKFARDVCCALLKLAVNGKASAISKTAPLRFPHDHVIFERLAELVVKGVENMQDQMWVPMTEQAVTVIYQLAEHPDHICENIIRQMFKTAMEPTAVDDGYEEHTCKSATFSRFLFLCGHIALCQMTYMDIDIFTELKRRHHVEEEEKAMQNKSKKKRGRRSFSAKASVSKVKESLVDSMDEDCGITGAGGDDIEAEYIHNLCDKELVTGTNLLACLSHIVVAVASNPGKYPDPDLQAAASLSLAKFMIVSSDFCDAHMQLLITILEKSSEPTIRSNTIVALGDLARRFPNIVEPWTPHLYARLRDESFEVKHTALIILTHLILHDLIKVKGQISEMALCVVNSNGRIAGMAKLFFLELSRKGNAIYNLLPDIISRLSDSEVGTTEENFQAVLKYLLPYVQKDKLLENLVEKLCQRFSCTRLERQWRDLAFCISLLCLNERCHRKLLDNLSCYSDKLMEPQVYEYFCNITLNAMKSCNPEHKTMLEELEQKFREYHSKGVEEEGIYNKASQAIKGKSRTASSVKAKKANASMVAPSTARKTRAKARWEAAETDVDHVSAPRSTRSTTKKKPKPMKFSSDEDKSDF